MKLLLLVILITACGQDPSAIMGQNQDTQSSCSTSETDEGVVVKCNGKESLVRHGKNGDKGLKGDKGDQGKEGTNGTKGTDGIAGTDGSNGASGTDGANGNDGVNGDAGTNGTNGQDALIFDLYDGAHQRVGRIVGFNHSINAYDIRLDNGVILTIKTTGLLNLDSQLIFDDDACNLSSNIYAHKTNQQSQQKNTFYNKITGKWYRMTTPLDKQDANFDFLSRVSESDATCNDTDTNLNPAYKIWNVEEVDMSDYAHLFEGAGQYKLINDELYAKPI